MEWLYFSFGWFMESGITESGESIAVSVVPAKCWTCGPSMVLSQLSPTSCLPCTMSSRWSSSSLAPGSDGSLKWQRNFTALLYVWSGSTSTTYSWPVASWQVVLPVLFFSPVMWLHICVLRNNTHEAAHQILLVKISTEETLQIFACHPKLKSSPTWGREHFTV